MGSGVGGGLCRKSPGTLLTATPASSPDWGLHGDPGANVVGGTQLSFPQPDTLPLSTGPSGWHCVPRAQRPAAYTVDGQ